MPALFFLTLVVTFPSLYVFNALVGSRLNLLALFRLLVAALAVQAIGGAAVAKEDDISPMVSVDRNLDPHTLVITLEGLLTHTSFAADLRTILKALEFSYSHPVDVEFGHQPAGRLGGVPRACRTRAVDG